MPQVSWVEQVASRECVAIAEIDRAMGTHESLDNAMSVKMHMQLALAMAHDEDMERFIAEHRNDSFREVFEAHPEYVEQYKHDPEAVLKEISAQIYH